MAYLLYMAHGQHCKMVFNSICAGTSKFTGREELPPLDDVHKTLPRQHQHLDVGQRVASIAVLEQKAAEESLQCTCSQLRLQLLLTHKTCSLALEFLKTLNYESYRP